MNLRSSKIPQKAVMMETKNSALEPRQISIMAPNNTPTLSQDQSILTPETKQNRRAGNKDQSKSTGPGPGLSVVKLNKHDLDRIKNSFTPPVASTPVLGNSALERNNINPLTLQSLDNSPTAIEKGIKEIRASSGLKSLTQPQLNQDDVTENNHNISNKEALASEDERQGENAQKINKRGEK